MGSKLYVSKLTIFTISTDLKTHFSISKAKIQILEFLELELIMEPIYWWILLLKINSFWKELSQ